MRHGRRRSRLVTRLVRMWPGSTSAAQAEFGDPRTDPGSLNVAIKELASNTWRVGYASLVQKAGKEPRIGWRGPIESSVRISAADGAGSASDPEVESLVADLLGATLVDAQDELWTACSALERAGSPEPARTWLTGPPPWPPASIEKYLKREGENAMTLIETLAAEVSPQPAAQCLARPELALAAPHRGRPTLDRDGGCGRWGSLSRATVPLVAAGRMDGVGPATVSESHTAGSQHEAHSGCKMNEAT